MEVSRRLGHRKYTSRNLGLHGEIIINTDTNTEKKENRDTGYHT